MKKFKFQLDSLLKFRKRQEEEALRNYVEARRELQDGLSQLDKLYQSVDDTLLEMQEISQSGGQAGERLVMLNRFIAGQKIRIERQKQQVRQLKNVTEEKEAHHLEAAKEFKIVEKLKEKRWHRFKQENKRREEKDIDDLMVMRGRKGAV